MKNREEPGDAEAKRALRESEERLRMLVANAPVMMGAIDREGVFTVAEGAAKGLLPFKTEEHIGRSVFDLYRDMPGVCDAARRALAGETLIITVDAGSSTVDVRISPIRDLHGAVTGAVAVATDVTERARAERALRESEETFRGLAEGSIDGIAFSEGLEVLFVNPALVKMLGYDSADEIVGRPFTDFVSPGDREMMVERGRARGEGQDVPDRYEFRALRRDGSEFDVEISISEVRYVGRRVRLAIIRDVTDRKRAEEALRESEGRFRILSEATFEAIAIHENGLIVDANQQSAAMLGYDVSDLIGREAFSFIAPESRDLVRERTAAGYGGAYEVLLLRKDGTTLPAEICGKEAFYHGRRVRIGVSRDISERKGAEEALQAARDELETRVERRMSRAARYNLTFRELTVLYLVAAGMADKEIASRLGISPRTASKHLENILSKMGATSRTKAGVRAIEEGLVERRTEEADG